MPLSIVRRPLEDRYPPSITIQTTNIHHSMNTDIHIHEKLKFRLPNVPQRFFKSITIRFVEVGACQIEGDLWMWERGKANRVKIPHPITQHLPDPVIQVSVYPLLLLGWVHANRAELRFRVHSPSTHKLDPVPM